MPIRIRSTINQPIVPICLRSSRQDTVPICLRNYTLTTRRADTPAARTRLGRALLPRIRPRCWHYTATRTTLSLVPYYYPTRQRLCYAYSLTNRTIAPIRLRSNDQLIDRAPSVRPTITTRRLHRTATRIGQVLAPIRLRAKPRTRQ